MICEKYKKYEFLSITELEIQFKDLLIEEFSNLLHPNHKDETDITTGFIGRGRISKFKYKNYSYVARLFRRGGLVAKVNSTLFFGSFFASEDSRPFREFKILQKLVSHGVKVPTPKAAMVKKLSGKLYQGALVTNELLGARNLLDLILVEDNDRNLLIENSYRAGVEAAKSIQAGVHHIDLHPGNVLCLPNAVYLIDFDNAKCFKNNSKFEGIANQLINRWDRSLIKRIPKDENIREGISSSFKAGVYYKT